MFDETVGVSDAFDPEKQLSLFKSTLVKIAREWQDFEDSEQEKRVLKQYFHAELINLFNANKSALEKLFDELPLDLKAEIIFDQILKPAETKANIFRAHNAYSNEISLFLAKQKQAYLQRQAPAVAQSLTQLDKINIKQRYEVLRYQTGWGTLKKWLPWSQRHSRHDMVANLQTRVNEYKANNITLEELNGYIASCQKRIKAEQSRSYLLGQSGFEKLLQETQDAVRILQAGGGENVAQKGRPNKPN